MMLLVAALALLAGRAVADDQLKLNLCGNPPTQQWLLNPDGVHNQIVLKHSGLCVDAQGKGTADKTPLVTFKCHPELVDPEDQNQAFVFDEIKGTITELVTGKVWDRVNSGMTEGTKVQLYHPNQTPAQQWSYNATDLTIRATDSGLCVDAGGLIRPDRPCDVLPGAGEFYCDHTQPLAQRVKDLVLRLTVEERINMMEANAQQIERLHIQPYQYTNEALHGIAESDGVTFGGELPYATSFPQVIAIASSFNRSLFRSVSDRISTEARAFNNAERAGLTFYDPNINILRDPRWGRSQETPGEDPYLTSEFASEWVQGMQGSDPTYLKTSATCKHFVAYDFEKGENVDKHTFDAVVSEQDMADTFLPPFQACVQQGKATAIMCSVNKVNGVPACASKYLQVARDKWGFKGYVVTDENAIKDIVDSHKFVSTAEEGCRIAIEAGTDLEYGGYFDNHDHLLHAYESRIVTLDDINRAVTNTFSVQFRLGMFDPATKQPYLKLNADDVNNGAAKALALDAARQGVVLLKNTLGGVPFGKSVRSVAVIGPNADAKEKLLGNTFGRPESIISVVDGVSSYASVKYEQACDIQCDSLEFGSATELSKNSDATVIVVGLDTSIEDANKDRKVIFLPGMQDDMVRVVSEAAKGPVAVVVISGSSVDLHEIKNMDSVDVILWTGYPGQAGGQAIADVLFGSYNPGGKLPFTMYLNTFVSEVKETDMSMRPHGESSGRTYRFYNGEPVYPFGYGLSYTTFAYNTSTSNGMVERRMLSRTLQHLRGSFLSSAAPRVSSIAVVVTNTGDLAGTETVLAFIEPPQPGKDGAPFKTLIGFERVLLMPGESKTVVFPVTAMDLSVVGKDGMRNVQNGVWKASVGSQVVPITVA